VRLEHSVSRIDWDADGVTVHSSQGVHRARHVIVTVPVGVLQSGAVEFEPPLPEPVDSALWSFRMNDFEKVVLRFEERFWDADVYAIRRQGAAGDWWHSWYDLTPLHGVPTLLTFAAGPAAIGTRGLPDAAVADLVLAALRELYGPAVPAPIAVHRTAWKDDPWSLGAYSYLTVGADVAEHDRLATPVGGVLQIAGEATWGDDPATVTAAMMSGHRAAEQALGESIDISELWAGLGADSR
ncbi:MAG TPA: NAD(P)/FAD-dependent oxidoreductase, partial [Microbacteriaceae bacterium]|nr:NAD(P)/FAD-dependent oxidoreductase [Microbacteriaceae bacterium]